MKPMGKPYRRHLKFVVTVILAILMPVFLAPSVWAADAKVDIISNGAEIRVTSADGKTWALHYGQRPEYQEAFKYILVNAKGDRTWFSHGSWLRLIDTKNGLVLGRWHFTGVIQKLELTDNKVAVTFAESRGSDTYVTNVLLFDPVMKMYPVRYTGWLLLNRVSSKEAYFGSSMAELIKLAGESSHLSNKKPDPATLREYEEQVRRDPYSPWTRIVLGTMLRDSGDPLGKIMLAQALDDKTTDFTELFNISSYLDLHQEPELARQAFEKGFADFYRNGNDPRLLTILIARLVLYSHIANRDVLNAQQQIAVRESVYRLMPYGEASDFAWELQSRAYAAQGKTEEAQLWHQRAMDASRYGSFTFQLMSRYADYGALIGFSTQLAAFILLYVLALKYRAQRKVDFAAGRSPKGFSRFLAFLHVHYWSNRERTIMLAILFTGWLALGVAVIHVAGIVRIASTPLDTGIGNYQSPFVVWFFKERGVATPERDACLALAYQQNGNPTEAERIYRTVPQFAMAWNNLGVILKQQNKATEARAAFEKAIQLDPDLHEAELNLHGKATDTWTQYHQQYLPGELMLTVPDKKMSMYSMTAFSGWNRLRILLGPLADLHVMPMMAQFFHNLDLSLVLPRVFIWVTVLQMLFALIVFLTVPHYEVTQAPGVGFTAAQYLVPGLSASNLLVGAPVFFLWSYLLVQLTMLKVIGSSYLITFVEIPNFKGFGLIGVTDAMKESVGLIFHHAGDWNTLLNPSWQMAYVLPAVLFMLNVLYVWLKRRSASV